MVDEHSRIRPFATPAGLGPADLQSAYSLTCLPASTVTIAIVIAFNYPNVESDLAQFRSMFGLPSCTKANGCLTVINQNGATSPLPGNSPAGDDWTVEGAVDLDIASAACPTCKLLLVEAQDDQSNGLLIAQNAAAAAGAVVVSNSWGGPSGGLSSDQSMDSQFLTHAGNITTFVASGDNGNTGATPDYPSTSHLVVGVGGTSLSKANNTRGWTETAWSGAGSSCGNETQPSFQSGVVPTSACTKRAAADVSAVADPNTGVAVFNAGSGGFIVIGGTSVSSPLVAAIYARAGVAATSAHDASYVYAHACELFDVTLGADGNCNSALCKATTGWDGPTGLGSPNGILFGKNSTCLSGGGTVGSCSGGGGGSGSGSGGGGGSGSGGGGGPGVCSHDLCDTGTALISGCSSPISGNATCVSSLCAREPSCCTTAWGMGCAHDIGNICALACPGN